MTYTIMFDEPVYNMDEDTWLSKSYLAFLSQINTLSTVTLDQLYENKFDLKLLTTDGLSASPITGVRFRSEEEATMFILKWS